MRSLYKYLRLLGSIELQPADVHGLASFHGDRDGRVQSLHPWRHKLLADSLVLFKAGIRYLAIDGV